MRADGTRWTRLTGLKSNQGEAGEANKLTIDKQQSTVPVKELAKHSSTYDASHRKPLDGWWQQAVHSSLSTQRRLSTRLSPPTLPAFLQEIQFRRTTSWLIRRFSSLLLIGVVRSRSSQTAAATYQIPLFRRLRPPSDRFGRLNLGILSIIAFDATRSKPRNDRWQ